MFQMQAALSTDTALPPLLHHSGSGISNRIDSGWEFIIVFLIPFLFPFVQ
jgi:hypothetical protein